MGAGTVVLCLVALLAMLWPQGSAASSGNAAIKLQKTVDAATITPVLALSLSVDKPQAIPGDTLTYSSTVTNTAGVLGLTGRFVAEAQADTDATAVYYWDELQACLTGCGNGLGDPHWTALVAFVASRPNYQPVAPPAVTSGMSLTATPIPASDVTYPTSGDPILGTDIGATATAAWQYQATVPLTPAEMAALTDPKQVRHLRNVFHVEVQPRNSTAAQPFDDAPQFVNPLQAQTNATAASNVVVTITLPSGQTVQFSSSATPALGSLAPGASVNLSTSFMVPVIAAKGRSETDAAYLARLAAINSTTLQATVAATGSGPSGPVSVQAPPGAVTIEQVPIVGITKSGPGASEGGTTVTYQLALQNSGGVAAGPLTITDTLSDGGTGTVSGVPLTLAAGATGMASAVYAIPAAGPPGTLTDTAVVTWKDANANLYGPVSSAFDTQVAVKVPPEIQTVTTNSATGNFFAEPSSAQSFVAKPGDTPAFQQDFPTIDFNPPSGIVPHNISGVGPLTRPFTDVTTDLNGDFAGTIVAQGSGQQAGLGGLSTFDAVFTANMFVTKAGDVTFNVLTVDGFLLGFGGGATRVSGANENPPASATTPFKGYPLQGAFNLPGPGSPATYPVTVHFPAPGTYPYELDYFSCCGTQLSLTMTVATFTAQTSPLSVFVGYADGLRQAGSIFPFPWAGSPNVTFVGCTGCAFDSGALRFDNSSSSAMTLDAVTVDVAQFHFDLWPHSLTIPSGGILILTQTAQFNFDTSDFSNAGCGGNNGVIPKVNVTQGGVTTSFNDTNQILNTFGFDLACKGNESQSWQRIGGGGTAINVPLPPADTLTLAPALAQRDIVGQTQVVTVAAMDGSGKPVANLPLTLIVSGANTQRASQNTDAKGVANFSYVGFTAGTDSINATAFIFGLRVVSNATSINWVIPNGGTAQQAPPSITSPSPADGTVVTKPVPISATFTAPAGQTIASWSVSYQELDALPPVTIASGTGTPPNPIATFDPTVLPNDTYAITISATASGSGTQSATITVSVFGNLKLGRYVTTFQDLSVPVNGFEMQVRRVYDSIDKHVGDFGVGWHVDLANFRVSANRVLGAGGWTEYPTSCIFGLCNWGFKTSVPQFVTVTFPDQHQEVFDFTPQGGAALLYFQGTAAFTARPGTGTTSKLEPLDAAISYDFAGNLTGTGGFYNPTRFRLTTRDGRVLVLDTGVGLVSETDRNGNSLSVDGSGVHASNGSSIVYARDTAGRITQVTGPSGQTLSYSYSAAGDLARSTDANGNLTSYTYDTNHNLLKASGSGGQPLQTLQYDSSGRLTAVTDSLGNTTQISSNVSGQQQTVVDATGTLTTVLTYDNLGDLLRQDQISGGQTVTTTATYDPTGRPLTRTDPGGHVWTGTYDAAGDLTMLALPSTHTTAVAYDANGAVTAFTNALGHTRTYNYDASGNLALYTNSLGAAETFTYDSSGHALSHADGLGRVTKYGYDAAGNLASTTDPRGSTITLTNDATGRILTQTSSLQSTTTFAYDGNGNVTSITDPLGNVTRYAYNPFDQIVSSTDPAGKVASYTYDADSRLASQVDPLGRTTKYSYDADSRLISITDPTGAVTSYTYDGFGRLASQTDPLGRRTSYTYDLAGRLTTTTRPDGGVVKDAYDSDGHLVSETDPMGRKTTYTYDAAGHELSVTDPVGSTTSTAYDAEGRPSKVIDALGSVTTRAYDAAGELVSVTDPLGRTTTYSFDAAGNQVSVTDPLGRLTTSAYDADNRLTSVTDPLGRVTTYGYDAAGQHTFVTVPSGAKSTMTYDARGLVTTVTDPLIRAVRYAYDDAGQVTSVTDPLGRATTYTYDGAGRPIKIVDALGGAVTLGLDAGGEQTAVTNPHGDVTKMTYDALGNVATETNPAGGVTTNTYDLSGELTKRVDPRGVTVTYTYDAAGRQVNQTIPGGSIATSYDKVGREATVVDPTGTTSYTYDSASQVSSVAAPQGTLTYAYDGAGNRTAVTMPGGKTVTYAYDAANQLTQLKDWLGNTTSLSYNANGSVASVARANGVATAYTYDAAEQLVALNHDGPSAAITHYVYTYDAAGNRTSVTSAAGKEQYAFDALNRLTQVTYANNDTESFTYDAAGNRTSTTLNGTTTNYTYNATGQLTAAGSTTYAYDAAGNVTSAGTNSFTWDYADRLASGSVGGTTSSYAYNADGVRTSATTGTTTTPYLTDSGAGLPQVVNDGSTSYVDAGSNLAEQVSGSGTAAYPLGDALGSVRQITDPTGAVVGSAAYSAYGAVRSHSGVGSIFGFAGQQTDPTGLLFLRARYYDPAVGRFLSADTLQPNGPGTQGFNAYGYVAGRPTTLTDPTGHGAVVEFAIRLAIAAGVGAAIGGVLGALLCPHDANYGNCILRAALFGALAGLLFALFPAGFAPFGSELAGACIAGAASGAGATAVQQLVDQSPDVGALAGAAGLGCVTAGAAKVLPPAIKKIIGGRGGGKGSGEGGGLPKVRRVPRDPKDAARENQYPTPPRANNGKGSVGTNPTQARDLQSWLQQAVRQNAQDIRVNQEQVNAAGVRVGINRPDLQYTVNGQRIYVEFDTADSPRGMPHAERICANDPLGIVFLVVSPSNSPPVQYACS